MTEWTEILFFILGIASLGYLLAITVYCGFLPAFSWFWAGVGSLFLCGGFVLGQDLVAQAEWMGWLCLGIWIFLIAFGAMAGWFFVSLFRVGNKRPEKGADYLIVLGAKVKGNQPTRALYGRIQAAGSYLKENPDTIGILTGGVGKEAQISEAACMERELLKQGIEPERLRKEEVSTTTKENIANAGNLVKNPEGRILIVTSDFHVKRGIAVAKDAGFSSVEGLGAASVMLMTPHYYTRELFAWIRYGLQKGQRTGWKREQEK